MSNNREDSKLNDEYIKKHISMIKDIYEGEKFLDNKILKTKIKRKESFVLFDKDWLDKWKSIVGYETLKEKCFKCKTKEDINKQVDEVRDLFVQLNTKQKLDELGKMDSSKLKKISEKKQLINEESNFFPILASNCIFFSSSINGQITINSEISNGIIYIYEPLPEKDTEQKLILLYKEDEKSKDLTKSIITIDPKTNIKDVIKELTNNTIEEILKQKEINIKTIRPESEIKRKQEELERKKKEAEDELQNNMKKGRRSSLKGHNIQGKLDPNNLLKFAKEKRHSVSFGQANTFQFKAMKAMFEEKSEIEKPKNKEEHNKFLESRRKSIKNEFSLVKEMMKKNQDIIKELEDSDEEVKQNTDKNVKMGHEELNEESSKSENSNDSENEN